MKKKYDVAVIGGGVVGAGAAWKLSKAGAKVALIEKDTIGSGASSTNPGFCVISYRDNALVMDMALRQQREWDQLQAEIGDVEFRHNGGMVPLTDDEQTEALRAVCKASAGLGLKDMEIISAKKAVELEPELNEAAIVGACWCPDEGMVNPFLLNTHMADAAVALGADILQHTAVTGFHIEGGTVKGIETTNGEIEADLVVMCTGAWGRELASYAGIDIPIYYERGEAMVTMQVGPMIRSMITEGCVFTQMITDEVPMIAGSAMGQTAHGNIVLAQATSRPGNYDKTNTLEGMQRVAKHVCDLFPALEKVDVIRMWSGLVSYSEDHHPILGAFDDPKNLFIINSLHSSVAISPLLGELTANYWKSGILPDDAKPYTPMRFLK